METDGTGTGTDVNEWSSLLKQKPARIASELARREWDPRFKTEIATLKDRALYSTWQTMLEDPGFKLTLSQYRQHGDSLTGANKKKLEKRIGNRTRYLSALTDQVLTVFRRRIRITDQLFYLLVSNELTSNIMFLLQHPEYFNWQIGDSDPYDVAIVFAVDTCNLQLFMRVIDHVKQQHLQYIYHYAPLEFLPLLIKLRRDIPEFERHIQTIYEKYGVKTWKQRDFVHSLRSNGLLLK